jgi:hypothetical protein
VTKSYADLVFFHIWKLYQNSMANVDAQSEVNENRRLIFGDIFEK